MESSLQFSRPRQHDLPACQARASQLTNCQTSPVRVMKKWLETSSPRMPWK